VNHGHQAVLAIRCVGHNFRTPRRSTVRRNQTHADGFPFRRVGISVAWWEFRAVKGVVPIKCRRSGCPKIPLVGLGHEGYKNQLKSWLGGSRVARATADRAPKNAERVGRQTQAIRLTRLAVLVREGTPANITAGPNCIARMVWQQPQGRAEPPEWDLTRLGPTRPNQGD
jgi:hypothetical protein